MRILILSAQQLLAEVIRDQIRMKWPLVEVVSLQNAREAMVSSEYKYDISFVETETDDLDGLDVIPEFLRQGRYGYLIALLGRRDERTIACLLQCGPHALVDVKGSNKIEINTLLDFAGIGKRYTSPALHEFIRAGRNRYNPHYLTEQEELVLSTIGDGSGNDQAARSLGCSPETIRTHRANIMRKLGLHKKEELVLYAVQQSYVRFGADRMLYPGASRSRTGVCEEYAKTGTGLRRFA